MLAAPTASVSLVRCNSYSNEELYQQTKLLFAHLGGLSSKVRDKTVTIKLNLTGSPGLRFQGKALGVTHYTHPRVAHVVAQLLGEAGAKRVRFVESAWATGGPLEEYLLDSGWNVRTLSTAMKNVEYENTNALGKGKGYTRMKTANGGYIYPALDFNRSYEDTDFFVSLAKLKNHATCGVTLAMKNCFGNLPASIYGDDAGADAPNESPGKGRVNTCHYGKRQPAKPAPAELDQSSSREPETRMPRITVDVVSARPIDLSVIDGVESVAGGEGPWIKGLRIVEPHLLIAGFNMVATDTVATAAMGYDPRAPRGQGAFAKCDNTLLLAEARGLGTADLNRIDVLGLSIKEALYPFDVRA
jgi:uncharacterized protein (DUF362 family)